jgi:hypothetical protein
MISHSESSSSSSSSSPLDTTLIKVARVVVPPGRLRRAGELHKPVFTSTPAHWQRGKEAEGITRDDAKQRARALVAGGSLARKHTTLLQATAPSCAPWHENARVPPPAHCSRPMFVHTAQARPAQYRVTGSPSAGTTPSFGTGRDNKPCLCALGSPSRPCYTCMSRSAYV